jgi:hypothetical protein
LKGILKGVPFFVERKKEKGKRNKEKDTRDKEKVKTSF